MTTAWRYIRLFAYFIAFSFSKAFEFRFDFWMRILMDVLYYAVAISFFEIIFLHTPTLGGWTEPEMMIFVAAYCIVDAVNMTLFSNNMWQMAALVNRGDLDYYLLRPISSLFFISLRDFAANSFVNLLITFGIFAWAVGRYPHPVSSAHVILFFVMILNGNLIFYCLNMLANIPVFYTHSSQGFGNLIWSLMKFGERPDRIYSGLVRRVLTTAIPFSVVASFPTRLLLEDFDWKILIHSFAVSAVFFTIVVYLWNRALRNYSSASS
jgi:ABC-2 type transport system permease protein